MLCKMMMCWKYGSSAGMRKASKRGHSEVIDWFRFKITMTPSDNLDLPRLESVQPRPATLIVDINVEHRIGSWGEIGRPALAASALPGR